MVDDRDYDIWDQPRISWHIKYQRPPTASSSSGESSDHDETVPRDILVADQAAVQHHLDKSEEDYVIDGGHVRNRDSYRLRAKMSIKKDDVQTVIPIAKQKEMINLAVLTGRQVSRPLKVYIVSRAGDVADVTLHSSCVSKDQSVLKVRNIGRIWLLHRGLNREPKSQNVDKCSNFFFFKSNKDPRKSKTKWTF